MKVKMKRPLYDMIRKSMKISYVDANLSILAQTTELPNNQLETWCCARTNGRSS